MGCEGVLGEVSLPLYRSTSEVCIPLLLDNQVVDFTVDTGSPYTVITAPLMEKYGLEAVTEKDFKCLDELQSSDFDDKEWQTMKLSEFLKGLLKSKPYYQRGFYLDTEVYVYDVPTKVALLGMDVLVAYNCSIINDMKNPRLLMRPLKK